MSDRADGGTPRRHYGHAAIAMALALWAIVASPRQTSVAEVALFRAQVIGALTRTR